MGPINLYSYLIMQRAWGPMRENGEIKRVIYHLGKER